MAVRRAGQAGGLKGQVLAQSRPPLWGPSWTWKQIQRRRPTALPTRTPSLNQCGSCSPSAGQEDHCAVVCRPLPRPADMGSAPRWQRVLMGRPLPSPRQSPGSPEAKQASHSSSGFNFFL